MEGCVKPVSEEPFTLGGIRMTSEPNNPGYRPEYKELKEARNAAYGLLKANTNPKRPATLPSALGWLAAEVRVMRLERALER